MRPVAPPGFNAPYEPGAEEEAVSTPPDSPQLEEGDAHWFNEEPGAVWEEDQVIHF